MKKGDRKVFIQRKLSTDIKWAYQALIKIFENQTIDEQRSNTVKYLNGIGFTGTDGEILSSFAKQYMRRKSLSPRQQELLLKKMPKYWRQILEVTDLEKLNSIMLKSLRNG